MRLRELDVAFGFCSSNAIRDDFLVHNDRDHDQLIFVNGRRLVSFDVTNKASFFFTQELSSNVTCITASSDKQYVATACEYNRTDETIVFIHKISSRKLASTFRHQERVTAICFSTESKHLILTCTSSIIVWDLKKECIILNGAIDAVCSRISCPSRLSTSRLIACASGPGGYCTLWSAFPSQQLSNISLDCRGLSDMKLNYVDHAWICKGEANDFFVAFIVEPFLNANTNVHIYVVHNVNTTQRLRMEFLQEIQNHDSQLRSITNLNEDSFAVSGTKGMMFVYNHDARCQQQKYLFSCSKSFLGSHDNCFNSIKQSTISNEIYVADFHKRKVLKVAIESEDCNDFSEVLSDTGHIGGILQIDSCYERPILMSCGMNDEMVYVWNYAQKRKIAKFDCKNDEPLSLAIHPSGYYAAVGFNERLTTFHILAESIKSHRSVLCHNPVSLLSFSAKYLAAVIGNTINLYEVYQKNASSCLILVTSFTGHIGSIKCICWSVDTFFSGGIDKNFYGWNIAQSSRIDNMNVLRSSGYCESIAFVSSSMRYDAACITSNGSLHRLFWSGNISEVCNVVSHTSEDDDTMSCLAFNSQDSMLVVGTYSGTIKCYTWSYTPENFSFHCTSTIPLHRSDPKSSSLTHAICCIRSAADNVMISGGAIDGSIFAISLDEHESIMASSHSPYENRGMVHAVLISADDYETKSNTIQTLNTKIKHLIAENEYNSHSREMLWKGELDSLSRKAEESLEEERQRYQILLKKYDDLVHTHTDELAQKNQAFERTIQDITASRIEALNREHAINEKLQNEINHIKDHYNVSLDQANTNFQERIRDTELVKEKQNKILQSRVLKLEHELSSSEKIYREVLDQQEEEFQYMVNSMKLTANNNMIREKESHDHTRMTLSSLKIERDLLVKSNDELKSNLIFSEDLCKKESLRIRLLQEELGTLEGRILELSSEVKMKSELIHALEKDHNIKTLSINLDPS